MALQKDKDVRCPRCSARPGEPCYDRRAPLGERGTTAIRGIHPERKKKEIQDGS